MKIYLSDICARCSPESLGTRRPDPELTERVKAQVFSQTGLRRKKATGRRTRIIILVAAMVSLFVTSAFALSRYFMEREALTRRGASGYWTELDEGGELFAQQEHYFPDAGMVFNFTGPDEQPGILEFRCFWLPEEPNEGGTDNEGWTGYLACMGEGADMPYIISGRIAPKSGNRLVLNGEVTVIKEEYWGDWYVLCLSSDYTQCKMRWPCEKANYVLLFDEQRGYLVTLGGSLPMETLEHIARELEIRDSGKPAPDKGMDTSIGQIDIGRG